MQVKRRHFANAQDDAERPSWRLRHLQANPSGPRPAGSELEVTWLEQAPDSSLCSEVNAVKVPAGPGWYV